MKWAAVSFRTTKVPSLIATSNDREPPSGSPQITVNTHCSPKPAAVPQPRPQTCSPQIRLLAQAEVQEGPCGFVLLHCQPAMPAPGPAAAPIVSSRPASTRPAQHKAPGRGGEVPSRGHALVTGCQLPEQPHSGRKGAVTELKGHQSRSSVSRPPLWALCCA